ncbi:hypothetical protein EW146_g5674 [Bondarzewia mesenterica]|uniref:Lon N-terminal domain-containing protein n=1 Tax=Bondarzewia mesenterica TaxID=1095465 RepID=A0A4S4LRS0_9AGAM|nr:hypothetical protein EW146_g5674 [Bondarzewia mesenterica]
MQNLPPSSPRLPFSLSTPSDPRHPHRSLSAADPDETTQEGPIPHAEPGRAETTPREPMEQGVGESSPSRPPSRSPHTRSDRASIPFPVPLNPPLYPPLPPPLPLAAPMHSALVPLIQCPVCNAGLVAPVTLLCGHTVCSRHVPPPHTRPSSSRNPHCPMPDCSAQIGTHSQPTIHPTSRVAFYPANTVNSDPLTEAFSRASHAKIDVTLSKVINLIRRAEAQPGFVPTLGHDSDEHTDDELPSDPEPAPSSSRIHSHSPLHLPPPRSSSAIHPPNSPGETSSVSPNTRSRKRRRRQSQFPSDSPPDSPLRDPARFEKELLTELTCEICFTLLYQPVTTPCQHITITSVPSAGKISRGSPIFKTIHTIRQSIPSVAFSVSPVPRVFSHNFPAPVLKSFPDLYTERGQSIEEEERDARLDTPIFVGQLSFPGMPTPYRDGLTRPFPRYRLMLRRCLESPNPRFGMIMPPRGTGDSTGNDFGTMLEIRSVRMHPDGRSVIETWGTHRFRIMERGTLDGYMVGRIERIDDFPEDLDDNEASLALAIHAGESGPSSSSGNPIVQASAGIFASAPTVVFTNETLMEFCRNFVDQLQRGTAPWVVQRLNSTYGPMPSDPSAFCFWMALVLPIDEVEKSKLLPIKSPRLRLRLVVYWIEQLSSNWYVA